VDTRPFVADQSAISPFLGGSHRDLLSCAFLYRDLARNWVRTYQKAFYDMTHSYIDYLSCALLYRDRDLAPNLVRTYQKVFYDMTHSYVDWLSCALLYRDRDLGARTQETVQHRSVAVCCSVLQYRDLDIEASAVKTREKQVE